MTDMTAEQALQKLLATAEVNPFCPVGHLVEHGLGGADALRAALSAQPAASAEPVLWHRILFGAETKPDGRCYDVVFCDPHDSRYTPLYAAPVAAPAPADATLINEGNMGQVPDSDEISKLRERERVRELEGAIDGLLAIIGLTGVAVVMLLFAAAFSVGAPA